MKVKTSELQGAALDWAVAKCEVGEPVGSFLDNVVPHPDYNTFCPSTDWAQGGPIIEREKISVMFSFDLGVWVSAIGELWVPEEGGVHGPTPLIAAMRCFVASKLGDEVEVPDEIVS